MADLREVKQADNGHWVSIYAKAVTAGTDQLYQAFYLEDADRMGAIRVNMGSNPFTVSAGDMVDVSGVIKGTKVDRYIDYPQIAIRFPGSCGLGAWFLANKSLGGHRD